MWDRSLKGVTAQGGLNSGVRTWVLGLGLLPLAVGPRSLGFTIFGMGWGGSLPTHFIGLQGIPCPPPSTTTSYTHWCRPSKEVPSTLAFGMGSHVA